MKESPQNKKLEEILRSSKLVAGGFMGNDDRSVSEIIDSDKNELSRLGLIEHVSYLNSRYDGRHGWKLSTRFERSLNQLAQKCAGFRDTKTSSKEKDSMLVDFANARRETANSSKFEDTGGETL